MDGISKERFFSVELKSKVSLKNVTMTNGGHEKVLVEGTIGNLQQAGFTEGLVLEMSGKLIAFMNSAYGNLTNQDLFVGCTTLSVLLHLLKKSVGNGVFGQSGNDNPSADDLLLT